MGHRTLFLALLALLLLATTSGQGSNGDRTNRPGAMECTTGDAAGDGNTCNAAGADSEQPVTNGEKRGSVEGGAGGEIDANTPELEAFEALIVSIKNSKELTDAQKANVMEEYEATKGWILSRKENEKKKTSNGGGGGGSGSDDDSASDGEDGTTAGSSLSMSVPIKEIRGAGGASGNDNSPGVNSVDNGDVGGGAAKGNDATGGGGGESYFRNKYKHVVAEKTGVKVSSGDDSREDDKKAKQQQQQDAAGADAKGVPTSKKRATTTEEARQRRAEELQKRVESLGKGGGKKGGPPRKKYKIKINNGKKSRAIGSGGTSGNTNSRGTTGDSTTDSSRSSSSSSSSSDSNGGGIGRIPAGSNNNNNNNNGGGGELTKRTILDNNATTDITDALLDVLAPYGNTCFKDRYDEDAEYRFSACFFAEITQQENSKSLFQERKYSLGKWAGFVHCDRFGGGNNDDLIVHNHYRVCMLYDNGDKCPGSVKRSTILSVGCGITRTLYTVREPSTCSYRMRVDLPAMCPEVTRALTNIATKPIRLSNGYLHELLIDMLYYVSYFLTVVLIVGPTAWEYGGGFLYRRYIMETIRYYFILDDDEEDGNDDNNAAAAASDDGADNNNNDNSNNNNLSSRGKRSHRGPVPPGGDTRTIRRRRGSERGRENENVTSRDDGDSGRDRREEWTSERVQLPFATAFVVTVSIGEVREEEAYNEEEGKGEMVEAEGGGEGGGEKRHDSVIIKYPFGTAYFVPGSRRSSSSTYCSSSFIKNSKNRNENSGIDGRFYHFPHNPHHPKSNNNNSNNHIDDCKSLSTLIHKRSSRSSSNGSSSGSTCSSSNGSNSNISSGSSSSSSSGSSSSGSSSSDNRMRSSSAKVCSRMLVVDEGKEEENGGGGGLEVRGDSDDGCDVKETKHRGLRAPHHSTPSLLDGESRKGEEGEEEEDRESQSSFLNRTARLVWEVLSYPFLVAQDLLMSVLYPEPMNLVDLAYTVLVALALSAIIRNVWPIIYYDYLFPVQPLPLPTQAEVEAFLVYADSNDNGMISRKEALSLFGEMDKFIRMAEIETLWYTVEKAFKRMFEEEERCGYEEAEEILEDLSLFDYHNDWRERYDFADKWGDGDGTLDVEEMLIMVLPDIVPSTRGKWWREYEFPLLDKNRNGRASWEEYLAHMEAYHAMEEEGLALDAMKEQKMLWFYYDVDADRELTPNEFVSFLQSQWAFIRTEEMFKLGDLNEDEQISKKETLEGLSHFKKTIHQFGRMKQRRRHNNAKDSSRSKSGSSKEQQPHDSVEDPE